MADTMNLWIDIARPDLDALMKRVDGLILNDEEARMLTGENNLIRARAARAGAWPEGGDPEEGRARSLHYGRGAALLLFPPIPSSR